MTDEDPVKEMDAPFLITASELLERQTIRRRKLHLSTRSKAIRRLVELGLKAKPKG
jgi:4'-phosphopantetheinyl transferase EntD